MSTSPTTINWYTEEQHIIAELRELYPWFLQRHGDAVADISLEDEARLETAEQALAIAITTWLRHARQTR